MIDLQWLQIDDYEDDDDTADKNVILPLFFIIYVHVHDSYGVAFTLFV